MRKQGTKVLVTGGAGYIGSHMSVELLQAGFDVVVLDNLSNSSVSSVEAVQRITQKKLAFARGDIRDEDCLSSLFEEHDFEAVLHFAGLKAVGESVASPMKYYDHNVNGTLRLLEAMRYADCKTLVFSSSATVYGVPEEMPITEDFPTGAINPYGQTKLMIEHMLRDLYGSDDSWRISILRYFNPVGAHASGEIGEDPNDIPNNLMPYISQVAVGRLPHLRVWGNDYPTPDGTGVRDYIHVVDLARGHLKALEYIEDNPGLSIHNLGTGNGYSVLQALSAFEKACGKNLPFEIAERRTGDAAVSYADPSKAEAELGWKAEYDLERMCEDIWRWQSKHPEGFSD
ncbi:MAG: UDP-glucose 4-epimerase GalE [Pseudomonadales bacterium]|jgi:UDP-glucose 4-epimerase|nr:UDP-glucose 4-epimerase GalE [Pseudomonadales bacterium]MDP6473069.1 UDP-glucose 4-epimerase GalE [Pseudomonadales bacterium]MDP6826174.1 UDP-glucose 4-epimerase GalE [Pseudomonadales bacterium]MDP6971962.1 UDP-glucose 4-epimerase GalE [Pseudomonadales bacterium]|tara:strand:- start:1036 stop:2064 length:1029 start_codon:yes stop_codon:yes gene_type:complete